MNNLNDFKKKLKPQYVAAFSLIPGFIISLLLITAIFCCPVYADYEPVYEVDDIIVTASRIPVTFSELTRSVTVIDRNDIAMAPVHSLQDLLEYIPGVEIIKRGPHGVQADVSIRGCTFEQTLILIDGVKVNDPQTGHHNLNLPLTLDDIDRIEILRGQGSGLYGPNAFGGVINIITDKSRDKQTSIKAVVGDFEFSEGTVSIAYPIGSSGHHLSISRKKSGGYTESTDFGISTIHYGSLYQIGSGEFDITFGYIDKEFGANRFYSDAFPNEWEHTKTTLLSAGMKQIMNKYTVSSKLCWRRHKDDFILDRTRPYWYRNKHSTDVYGFELQAHFYSKLGVTAGGGEAGQEEIESSNLGSHLRKRGGFFLEHQLTIAQRFTLQIGAFACRYTDWGWEIWPAVNLGCQLSDRLRAFASVGRSFRVPTFTELFYESPANNGNPNLKPEKALTYEAGIKWKKDFIAGSLAVFRREGYDLIDWVRADTADPWQALNVCRANTNGAELSLRFYADRLVKRLPVSKIQSGYAFLDSDIKTDNFESKYVLNQLDHQFLFGIEHNLPFKLKQNWKFRYEIPTEDDSRFIVDSRISWKYKKLEWFVEATNMFNESYVETGSIPMPGRQVMTGLRYSLFSGK